jgi:hypothetical protein
MVDSSTSGEISQTQYVPTELGASTIDHFICRICGFVVY